MIVIPIFNINIWKKVIENKNIFYTFLVLQFLISISTYYATNNIFGVIFGFFSFTNLYFLIISKFYLKYEDKYFYKIFFYFLLFITSFNEKVFISIKSLFQEVIVAILIVLFIKFTFYYLKKSIIEIINGFFNKDKSNISKSYEKEVKINNIKPKIKLVKEELSPKEKFLEKERLKKEKEFKEAERLRKLASKTKGTKIFNRINGKLICSKCGNVGVLHCTKCGKYSNRTKRKGKCSGCGILMDRIICLGCKQTKFL